MSKRGPRILNPVVESECKAGSQSGTFAWLRGQRDGADEDWVEAKLGAVDRHPISAPRYRDDDAMFLLSAASASKWLAKAGK